MPLALLVSILLRAHEAGTSASRGDADDVCEGGAQPALDCHRRSLGGTLNGHGLHDSYVETLPRSCCVVSRLETRESNDAATQANDAAGDDGYVQGRGRRETARRRAAGGVVEVSRGASSSSLDQLMAGKPGKPSSHSSPLHVLARGSGKAPPPAAFARRFCRAPA